MKDELVANCASLPDISRPRWDQNTFTGRAYHFFTTANPLNVLKTPSQLEAARVVVQNYKNGVYSPTLTVDELWRAKNVYDSAFHPDTGEKMFVLGRMSAQVPCNMMIVGGMLTFHKKFAHVLFFQWINQSFNAIVNYTNRSGSNPVSKERLIVSYCCATSGAIATALTANKLVSKLKRAPPMVGNLVPFLAVALANAINIPMMRSNEFSVGIPIENEKGEVLGSSTLVPWYAIPQVVLSRVGMAVPNMVLGPVIVNKLMERSWYKPVMAAPLQILLCGFMLTFSTPLCCALFPQKSSFKTTALEPELQAKLAELPGGAPKVVYYNKGL